MSLFEVVEQFFTEDEWYYVRLNGQTLLQVNFTGKNGRLNCFAQTNEEQFIFFFYTICPVNVPEERRLLVAEFLTRANYGLKVGNFEIDMDDGEARFKTSIDVEKSELNRALVSNLVYANVWTMDRYLPGILSVTYGNESPRQAIDKIEQRQE
jgi:hypothetical protein